MGTVSGMDRRLKKLIAGAAVILLLGGASAAALTATGQSKRTSARAHLARPAHAVARRGGGRDLSTAAGYLGISTAQLAAKLSSGQSLAEIAAATPGRSAAGLIESLVSAKRAALALLAAKLPERVRAEVERPGGPRGFAALGRARGTAQRAGHHARVPPAHRLIATPGFRAAAGYLGMSATQLQSELESGRTLAAIANATSGKSESGLIDAIVAAKQEVLAAARAAGSITAAREKAMAASLRTRVGKLVKRTFARAAPAR
jgi:hypothetical protein